MLNRRKYDTHSLYPNVVNAACNSLGSIVPDLSRSKLYEKQRTSGIAVANAIAETCVSRHLIPVDKTLFFWTEKKT